MSDEGLSKFAERKDGSETLESKKEVPMPRKGAHMDRMGCEGLAQL